MQPYYDDHTSGITIYHADCRDILPTIPDQSIDLVLTDPPYAEQTHAGARTASRRPITYWQKDERNLIDFDACTMDDLRPIFNAVGRVARAWVIATMDWRHIHHLEQTPPDHLRFVRFGVWVKPNGTPQFTGDRPGTGWEAIAHLHRIGGRMRWNGGGRTAVYTHCIDTSGIYPSAKPYGLIAELIRLYSNPGDLLLDPFCGSGIVGRVARDLGRRAILIDSRERAVQIAAKRLDQAMLPFEVA